MKYLSCYFWRQSSWRHCMDTTGNVHHTHRLFYFLGSLQYGSLVTGWCRPRILLYRVCKDRNNTYKIMMSENLLWFTIYIFCGLTHFKLKIGQLCHERERETCHFPTICRTFSFSNPSFPPPLLVWRCILEWAFAPSVNVVCVQDASMQANLLWMNWTDSLVTWH